MERLNEKQKDILDYLNEVYPNNLNKDDLLKKLGADANDILADIKILEEKKLVSLIYGLDSNFPALLAITPSGKEKLQENFTTRLKDSIYENPLQVIIITVAIISMIVAANYYFETIRLQTEKASLEKPLLITPDTRVRGDSIAELKFVVKNPSHSIDYYYVSGSCNPEVQGLFVPPPIDKNTNQVIYSPDVPLVIQPTQNSDILIPAGGEITFYCKNNYIRNPTKDGITSLNICVNILNIAEQICNRMQVTVLKT